ncbi:unnamed protein product [Diabrotica balteata]|uniref:C2H2-type domain-containing protein n=1 Tax=Diabrotica balteata TaxID=107213 RepID=A0A9N9SVZ6_DIABA|nr:unnamed protein product [Diabrotica balteata]
MTCAQILRKNFVGICPPNKILVACRNKIYLSHNDDAKKEEKSVSCLTPDPLTVCENITHPIYIYQHGKLLVKQDENEGVQCPNCLKMYKNMNTFRRHFRYECGKVPQFACQYCPKAYTQKSNLKNHHIKCHPCANFM